MFADDKRIRLGSMLTINDQQYVLRTYVGRFTKEHRPNWASKEWKDGQPYPVQFKSDQEWLENTRFLVRKDGHLDMRATSCYSTPTWPDNPELRS